MRRVDLDDPRIVELDDKWMFTPAFFEGAARSGRWSECIVYPTHAIETPLRDQTRVNLRLGMQLDESALPGWVWDRLAQVERSFSAAARRELAFEGAAVMRVSPVAIAPEGRAGWWYEPAAPGRGFFVAIENGHASVVCCHYDDAGRAVWHCAGPGRLEEGRMSDVTRPPSATALSIDLAHPGRATLEWNGVRLALEPQHPGSPGSTGTATGGMGGTWVEDSDRPAVGAAVEDLGARLFAALLLPDGWCMSVATRRGADAYAGEWLRFSGGQSLTGAYRAPGAPEHAGEAHLVRTETDRLVVRLPDGTHRVLRRGVR